KAGARHAQGHGLRVVAIDAADGMRVPGVVELLIELLIRELERLLEAFHRVSLTEIAIDGHDRRMAMKAPARLRLRQSLRRLLIGEHVGVSAPIAIID